MAEGFSACGRGVNRKRDRGLIGEQSTALRVLPECYLGAWGLRGPQVRSAGGYTFPAVRANGQGKGRG